MVGVVWSNDPESYTGSSVATSRVSHARQVKGEDPGKKGYPVPPGRKLGLRMTTSPHNKCPVEKLLKLDTDGNNKGYSA